MKRFSLVQIEHVKQEFATCREHGGKLETGPVLEKIHKQTILATATI